MMVDIARRFPKIMRKLRIRLTTPQKRLNCFTMESSRTVEFSKYRHPMSMQFSDVFVEFMMYLNYKRDYI